MGRYKVKPITGPFTDEHGEYFRVQLTKCFGAKILREDVERVGMYNWCASHEGRSTKWYAVRREEGSRLKIRMHRFIMDQPPGCIDGLVVDHLGDDGLDNRRHRLEIITQEENMRRAKGWIKKKVPVEPSL